MRTEIHGEAAQTRAIATRLALTMFCNACPKLTSRNCMNTYGGMRCIGSKQIRAKRIGINRDAASGKRAS